MCDTMGVLLDKGAIFAKNSDRSPNEPQVTEWHAAKKHEERSVKTTYLEVEQAKETYAHLLSRPIWLWGGEMGVNECGVCIGNEAVFTKGAYLKTGLTGMDLLRIGLERGATAKDAMHIIIEYLERYGQGGNCGYDHPFYYDNSYLIMDKASLYVLETAGRAWAYKAYERASISNCLSLSTDADAYSGAALDFSKSHSDPLYTHFSGSKSRKGQTGACLARIETPLDALRALRTHEGSVQNPLSQSSVKSACMHAGGVVGDHATASMVVELSASSPRVWLTGSSTPCISLFKPYALKNAPTPPVFEAGDPAARRFWEEREDFHRALIGKRLPEAFYFERDALERAWIEAARDAGDAAFYALSKRAAKEERSFYEAWELRLPKGNEGGRRFRRYWAAKDNARAKAK